MEAGRRQRYVRTALLLVQPSHEEEGRFERRAELRVAQCNSSAPNAHTLRRRGLDEALLRHTLQSALLGQAELRRVSVRVHTRSVSGEAAHGARISPTASSTHKAGEELAAHARRGARVERLSPASLLDDKARHNHAGHHSPPELVLAACYQLPSSDRQPQTSSAPSIPPDDIEAPRSDVEAMRQAVFRVLGRISPELAEAAAAAPSAPLMTLGLSSEDTPDLTRGLEQAARVPNLSETLIFRYPTVASIAEHLCARARGVLGGQGCEPSVRVGHSHLQRQLVSQTATPAIVGLIGRWPSAPWASALDALLRTGHDAVDEVPLWRWIVDTETHQRFPGAARLATICGANLFDNQAFGVSPAEAAAMDPQQRLLLEVSHEAVTLTGVPLSRLRGSDTAVFLAISNNDFASMLTYASAPTVYAATGSAISVAAGRLSFTMGFHGPCQAIDTACSSALVALHGAAQGLQAADKCGLALMAAVSLVLTPHVSVAYARAGMLSPAGRCRVFDSAADGYARGEGVGGAVLALADTAHDEGSLGLQGTAQTSGCIVPELASSSVMHDGLSASLTAPNGGAQMKLLLRAFSRAGTAEGEMMVVEAHGTGTALGDPTEVRALSETLAMLNLGVDMRARKTLVGSVKASLGHLEPAAGLVGLCGLLACTCDGLVPANAQLRILNSHIGDAVASAQAPLCAGATLASLTHTKTTTGGVSSFGYSGTIAHAAVRVLRVTASTIATWPKSRPYRRRRFEWQAQLHPLLQHRTSSALTALPAVVVFRIPVTVPLLAIVAGQAYGDQGNMLSTGAFLEMVRAACEEVLQPLPRGVHLRRMTFSAPLLLDDAQGAWVSCEVDVGRKKFAVSSSLCVPPSAKAASELPTPLDVHCSGDALAAIQAPPTPELVLAREISTIALDVFVLYRLLRNSGLEFGREYRALAACWACEQSAVVVGSLHRRLDSEGTLIHPADLEGAMQLTAFFDRLLHPVQEFQTDEEAVEQLSGVITKPRPLVFEVPIAMQVDEAVLTPSRCSASVFHFSAAWPTTCRHLYTVRPCR
mmetsp:Transcript_7915/g.23738  ORF Transcript_7915/g.23738 Transcript_7915/m.23738 type:complete len:1045 (-) Transcript_7915:2935-6069(-)